MAQDPIIIGAADAKAGDNLFDAFTKINANTTDLYSTTATNAADIAANNALITGFTKTYWFDDNDAATAITPISHTGGVATTYLTNDAAGTFTTSYNPDSKDALWNPVTGEFDFTSLKLGDTVEIRIDIEVDTLSANQEVDLVMSLAEGQASPYELNMNHGYYKTVSSANKITVMFRVYMGDVQTMAGGSRFRFSSLNSASIKVNGWFYQITSV